MASRRSSDEGIAPSILRGTTVEPLPGIVITNSDLHEDKSYIWEQRPEEAIKRFGGTVEFGKLDAGRLENVVGYEYDEMERKTEVFGGPEILVCGPSSFEQFVYETLVDELGVDHTRITLIPPNNFVQH